MNTENFYSYYREIHLCSVDEILGECILVDIGSAMRSQCLRYIGMVKPSPGLSMNVDSKYRTYHRQLSSPK